MGPGGTGEGQTEFSVGTIGNTLTVKQGFTNNGSLIMYGSASNGGPGDKLNVSGTLTNNAGALLDLVDGSKDVANVHSLSNSGTIYIGRGTDLNLTALGAVTNSGNVGSSAGPGMVTNNGTLTVGSGNKFDANGTLTNFNSTTNTLTGGTYLANGGNILWNGGSGPGIKTLAANVTEEAGGQLLNTGNSNANFLANLTSITSTGSLTTSVNFSDPSSFSNAGSLTILPNTSWNVASLAQISGSTLTAGTYVLDSNLNLTTGTANVTTDSAKLTLGGGTIFNTSNRTSALAHLNTISKGGSLTLANSASFTTTGNFTNSGTLTVNSGSKFTTGGDLTTSGIVAISSGGTFTVGGAGVFTQTGGKTTDDGTLTDSGGLSLKGGSLFGKGTIIGAVTSSATVTPGDSATAVGILTDKGSYTQNSTGFLDISIAGITAGTKYDQFNITSTASLNGELNTKLISFTPTVGQTFTIMNYSSHKGTFTSCDGRSGGTTCPINKSEHFTITYNPTDVVLTVVKGAAPVLRQFNRLGTVDPPYSTAMPSRFGFGLYGTGRNFQHLSSRASVMVASGAAIAVRPLLASQAPTETMRSPRSIVDFSGSSKFINAAAIGLGSRATLSDRSIFSSIRMQTIPRAYFGQSLIRAGKLTSMDQVIRQSALNWITAIAPARNFPAGTLPHGFVSVGDTGAIRYRTNAPGALLSNNGHPAKMAAPKSVEYHLDVLSLLGTSRRQALRSLLGQPGDPNAASFGYLTFNGIH